MCCHRSERKQRKLVVTKTEEWMGSVLSAYGTTMTAVTSFKYLGRIMLTTKNNWPEVDQNLRRAQGKWGRMVKILLREGVDRRTAGRFYVAVVKAVVQAVTLFGSETWVVTPWL